MEKADIVIKNGLTVPVSSSPFRGTILVSDGEIFKILGKGKPKYKNQDSYIEKFISDSTKIINASGKAVLPGLVNTHTHLPMTLMRGYADDLPLNEWLEDNIWKLEEKLKSEDAFAGAMLGCLEMLKNGITCFSDMYFHMDDVVDAVKKSGMRASLSYGMISAGKNEEGIEKELQKGIEFAKKFDGAADGRITTLMAPHSPLTCSPDFLEEIVNKSKKYRMQIHVSETKEEFDVFCKKYDKTPVEFLQSLGMLSKNLLSVHCVHLTENDIKLLSEKKVHVSYNPSSNMKLASGIAPVKKMIENGINVSLGTDGAASNNSLDILNEARLAALVQKSYSKDPTSIPAWKALEMSTINGAKALGLENKIGTIEEGKRADLAIFDLDQAPMVPSHDVVSNLIYSSASRFVDTVIVDGKVVLESGNIKTFNEEDVIEEARTKSQNLIQR